MSWVLANTVAASVLALVVLVLERCWRPRPAVLHVLWLLALLRLCWPPWLAVELPVPLPWPSAEPAPALRVDLAQLAASGNAMPPAMVDRVAAPADSPPPAGMLPIAWAALAAVVAALLLVRIARCGHRLAAANAAPAWLLAEVGALAARLQVRAPAVVDEPRAASPFVWPFGRPRLVADAAGLAAMPASSRTAVLAHELAHLCRKDHCWLWLELLLLPLFCWHPLFWLLRARVREQAELACDAWALWAVPDARRPYAEALIQALEQDDPAPAVPVLAARPAARAFERRLMMIMTQSVPCRATRMSLAGCALLSLGVVLAPVRAQEREPKPRVEITIDGKRLEDLSTSQRQRLLRELGLTGEALELVLQARAIERGDAEDAAARRAPAAPERNVTPRRRPARAGRPDAEGRPDTEGRPVQDPEPRARNGRLDQSIRTSLRAALDEVERELADDPDLRELGITDEVRGLLGAIGGEGDFESALRAVVDQALVGATKQVQKEIAADPDLQRLGIADGLGRLIGDLGADGDLRKGLLDLAGQAMRSALQEARVEITADPDLRELGITGEVEALLDDLEAGKLDLETRLPPLIEKAMQGALRATQRERDSERERAPAPVRRR